MEEHYEAKGVKQEEMEEWEGDEGKERGDGRRREWQAGGVAEVEDVGRETRAGEREGVAEAREQRGKTQVGRGSGKVVERGKGCW